MNSEKLRSIIRNIPDFPVKGIQFKDITPLLKNPDAVKYVVSEIKNHFIGKGVKYIAGIEARGFIFGGILAYEMGIGFIPIRKKGKLPYKTVSITYSLEYGESSLEVHEDALEKGDKILIVDDLLATGGTTKATYELLTKIGGDVVGAAFIIELTDLKGREKIPCEVYSILKYNI